MGLYYHPLLLSHIHTSLPNVLIVLFFLWRCFFNWWFLVFLFFLHSHYICVFSYNSFFFFFVGVQVYGMCNAGAVIHSHGMESCLVTMINPFLKEFRVIYWILLSDDFSPSIFLKKIHFLIIEDLTLAFSYFSSVINSCFYRTNIWLHAFYNLLTFSLCRWLREHSRDLDYFFFEVSSIWS